MNAERRLNVPPDTNFNQLNRQASLQEVYSIPSAYFPASSDVPISKASDLGTAAAIDEDRQDLATIIIDIQRLLTKIQRFVIPPSVLHREIVGLRLTLADATAQARQVLIDLTRSETPDTTAKALQMTLPPDLQEKLLGYTIYDNYFRVFRVSRMTTEQLIGQIATTACHTLDDLPYSVLNIDEIAAILNAIMRMFQAVARHQNSDKSETSLSSSTGNPQGNVALEELANFWNSSRNESLEETHKVSLYRWIVGHHFFDLCSIFCRAYLVFAAEQFEVNNNNEGVGSLDSAKHFLRGTTAGMWYAGNLPSEIYQNYVRKTMISTKTPEGFSGDQNIDYTRMKEAKDNLKAILVRQYSQDTSKWPESLFVAMRDFHETDLLDNEHHILIAASKVGSDTSLAQKVWQMQLAPQVRRKTATEILRDMVVAKRRDLKF